MLTKCQCQQCGQPIEFEAGQFEKVSETNYRSLGQTIECPNCQQPTQLYIPRWDGIAATQAKVMVTAQSNLNIIGMIIGGVLIIGLGIFLTIQIAKEPDSISKVLAFAIGLPIYFCPSIAAALRRKKNTFAIFMLNFLLGWTFIGWVVALVWSCIND